MQWEIVLKLLNRIYQGNVEDEKRAQFNAFVLMSDLYRRENFHSDILGAILDPNSSHGEGDKFLRKFLEYLQEECDRSDQVDLLRRAEEEIDTSVSVVREAGRIDILITGHFKSGKEWQIIVENKLNNAVDMPRQLPRYLDYYWRPASHDQSVLALVYLKPSSDTEDPSQYGWNDEAYGWRKERGTDDDRVRRKLIKVAGYNAGKNLAMHWLKEKCLPLATRPNVRSVLEQYIDLLKIQSEEEMVRQVKLGMNLWDERSPL